MEDVPVILLSRYYCQIKHGGKYQSISVCTAPALGQVGPGSAPSEMEYQQSLRNIKDRAGFSFETLIKTQN